MKKRARWEIYIDRGGTFTDCIARHSGDGSYRVLKLLSTERAPTDGIRRLLQLGPDATIPPCDVRMGTTLATNALLERRGVPTAMAITRGFGDLLEIGTQARPELFALEISKPLPLPSAVIELEERCASDGAVLGASDAADLARELAGALARGARSIAIVVLNDYRDGKLEQLVAERASAAGFRYVAQSHEVAPELGLLARTDTTVLDAYLTPLLRDWVQELERGLPGSSLSLMQSSGGLTEGARFRGPNAILSGPAGGAVAVAEVARLVGAQRAIGFDMGGTSTDVCRWQGEIERVYETEVSGVRVRAPAVDVHTVAAGGGSLCRIDGQRLSVGPESAGAEPGPLAYGDPRAHELTLTDVNLVLGRLQPDRFPFALERARADARLEQLAAELEAQGVKRSPLQIAEGFCQIANHDMAEAIRRVTVARGHDARDHALVVFGGAGGQHACALAERLGIERVVFHPLSGVLSAWGIGLADTTWHGDRDAGRCRLNVENLARLETELSALEERGERELGRAPGAELERRRRLDLRYRGSESTLTLPWDDADALSIAFHSEHARRFGYARKDHPIELVSLRVELALRRARPAPPTEPAPAQKPPRAERHARLFHAGRFLEHVPVYRREALRFGQRLTGPAIVLEATSTVVLDPGFDLSVEAGDVLVLCRNAASSRRPEIRSEPPATAAVDPVLLEIMGNSFMSIAEQMGEVLRRTAFSTNIRERLDFPARFSTPRAP